MSYSGTIVAEYGGFWRRVGASLIDGIIFNIISRIMEMILGVILPLERLMVLPEIPPGASEAYITLAVLGANWGLLTVYVLIGMVGPVLYDVGMTASRYQATVGKMALGLQVVGLDGGRLSVWRALGRYFAKIPSALILGIGFLMVGWTERKQGLHDMIAGTLVVRKGTMSQSSVF